MKTDLTPIMKEATDTLISNLLASEAFVRYHHALAKMNKDGQAHALLEQLSWLQTDLKKKQSNGVVTQAEIDALRAVQEQVQQNELIMAYARTQQEAVNFLREINTEISQLLGINFASFTKPGSCC